MLNGTSAGLVPYEVYKIDMARRVTTDMNALPEHFSVDERFHPASPTKAGNLDGLPRLAGILLIGFLVCKMQDSER